jgi:hypothetical protein
VTKHNAEGYVWTAEQRANLRQASLRREATIRQKVSVNGVVYANFTRAAAATGISAKSIKRYALEGVPKQASRNRLLTPEQLALAKTITLVVETPQ